MKNIITYLSLLFILLLEINNPLNAQNPVLINDTLKPFGLGGYTFMSGLELDSVVYVSLLTTARYSHQYSGVIKLSLDGSVLDKKIFIDSSNFTGMYSYNTIAHDDHQFVICTQYQDTSKHVFGQVIAFDKHLDTLWTRRYGHPDTLIAQQPGAFVWSELTAIKAVPGNGFIAIGNYNKNCIPAGYDNQNTQIIKMDSLGNVQWQSTYSNYILSYDIEVLPDGGYIFIARPNILSNEKLVRIDPNGQVLWDLNVDTLAPTRYATALSLYDSSYIVVASCFPLNSSTSARGLSLTKINLNNKSISWIKTYYLFKGIVNLTLHNDFGLDVLPDGKLLVTATAWANSDTVPYAYSFKGALFKLDSNGDSLWAKSYCYGNSYYDCQFMDMILTSDGGYIAIGFHQNSGWILKTDANGYVGLEEEVALNKSHPNLELFPNPAKDILYVKCDKIPEKSQLSILDQNGRTLIQNHWPKGKNKLELNISNLPIGLFLLELKGYNEESITKKFVKFE